MRISCESADGRVITGCIDCPAKQFIEGDFEIRTAPHYSCRFGIELGQDSPVKFHPDCILVRLKAQGS